MNTDAVEAQITYPDEASAHAAAAMLVEARLAACGQVSRITSVYTWEGKVEDETEWLLTAKTLFAALPKLAGKIRESHPYDVPQITALPIAWGAPDYLSWIGEMVDT
ncbi:divalent-cation tolerance protein CutA [Maritimibacter sp. UBA3975]|uniref:divalent-cation tolerance protein CutA n=1 Tax=Maritimibacter sp. UBA3975 TaxID=1946833 RepID=UPI000C094A93|nr:divalent-cation tolerance protein CutA [Maritimibacter sp. UBA3975]MAM60478.1 divalent-cation tolerance protein CutA [Maritimibacter sp.]|tara:strand:+ start:9692 stop:10012 length:321 start_codon:yes stop_codon:yes gene_type:complete